MGTAQSVSTSPGRCSEACLWIKDSRQAFGFSTGHALRHSGLVLCWVSISASEATDYGVQPGTGEGENVRQGYWLGMAGVTARARQGSVSRIAGRREFLSS